MNMLWNLIGVKRTKIYSGEYMYERKYCLGFHLEMFIEFVYCGMLTLLATIGIGLNAIHGCGIGIACTVVGLVCGLALIPTVIAITEGYYCVTKSLW